MILKYWHYILLVVSILTIGIALVAEHFYNLQPCSLCLKQRHPYYLFIIISFIMFFILPFYRIYLSYLIQIGSIYGIFYSVWHVGVENKLFDGPSGCSSNLSISSNINDLKEQIFSKQIMSCEDVIWSFFGLSAATLNTIVLLFIFGINALYIFRHYAKKEKY